MHLIILIFVSLIFGACSEERTKPLYTVKLSDAGVGKIGVQTPFETRLIEPKFPGFDVQIFTFFKIGKPMPVIQISYRGTPWIHLFPTEDKKKIESISIVSANIESAWPTKIGMRFDETYNSEQLLLCKMGTDKLKDKIICKEPLSEMVYYVYEIDTELLENRVPMYSQLQTSKVDEIIWKVK